MEKSSMYFLLALGWMCSAVLWGSCSSDPGSPDLPDEPSAAVTFSVGSGASQSRAAFREDTPVKVYVFQREDNSDGVDLSATPFKTVEGKSSGSGNLSDITLTGGDLDANKSLKLPTGFTYDFVVVVNASDGATTSNLGAWESGRLTGFSHGADILSGRKEGVAVNVGQTHVNVTFTEYGADAEGNLPHLCSAVLVEAKATQALITHLKGSLDYAVSGMDFKQCLPRSADLPFGGDPMALNILGAGYTSSYSPAISGSAVTVTSPDNTALSKEGIILPYPLRIPDQEYNVLTIDFGLNVNGGNVTFNATGVRAPAFEPGYRYRFIVELDHDEDVEEGKVNLLLSVESWNSVSWNAGMGEGETHSWMLISLGSWNSVTWQAVMGEGETSNNIITSVSGWRSATWASNMGEY